MPRMEATATVTTTQEVRLAPGLRKKLLTKLSTYASLKSQLDAIKHAMKKAGDEIGELHAETGETSVRLDGYTMTLVAGNRKKFNPKLFVANGGDLAVYNQSIDEVPVKSYLKISVPGGSNDDEE